MSWVDEDLQTEGMANILRSHSLNPDALAAHLRLCWTIMLGESPLNRVECEALREVGLSTTRAIVDANQVVSNHKYVNRVADGLGVELAA